MANTLKFETENKKAEQEAQDFIAALERVALQKQIANKQVTQEVAPQPMSLAKFRGQEAEGTSGLAGALGLNLAVPPGGTAAILAAFGTVAGALVFPGVGSAVGAVAGATTGALVDILREGKNLDTVSAQITGGPTPAA